MRGYIKNLGITLVDDDVVDEESRFAEVVEQLPVLASVARGVNLSVKRAEVKAIRIRRIDDQGANVPSRRSGHAPIVRIECWIVSVAIRMCDGGIWRERKTE